MPIQLSKRDLLTLADYTPQEITHLLDMAAELKRLKRVGVFPQNLRHKNIAAIFLKPSCRTRTAVVVAAHDEGAHCEVLSKEDVRIGVKESVKDVARVLGRMFDGILFRGHEHGVIEEFARHAGVPVWNGLSEDYHPTQVLADLLTIRETFGSLDGIAMTYIGDGRNNQANSLLIGAAKMGLDMRVLAPPSLQPSANLLTRVRKMAESTGAKLTITTDRDQAMNGTHVVYGDVWVSMGEEDIAQERVAQLRDYKVTFELLERSGRDDTIYLHCLPALHDGSTEFEQKLPGIQEVADDVFESDRSLVFEQSENRMHTIKAVMVATV